MKSQVHCLETKHLISYSRKQGKKGPSFLFCVTFVSAIFTRVYLTSNFSLQPQMFGAKPQMLSG